MRIPYKRLILLALVALTGLSCTMINHLVGEPTQSPLVFKPDQLPDAQVGVDYNARIRVEESSTPVGAFTLQDGELPPGLTLEKVSAVEEESAAVISGTPTQAGTYKFVIHVWCYGTQKSGQTGQKEYTIVVK